MKRIKPDQFHFKKFSVTHKRSSMKVGTDGVLLGAWADVKHAHSILDIGTGTGLIALMLAQRTPNTVYIDAVELNPEACHDARENFSKSPWEYRIHLYEQQIQVFTPQKKYDLIVTNPPYFTNSFKPSYSGRTLARHTDSLSHEDIIAFATAHLSEAGVLSVILPFVEGLALKAQMKNRGLYLSRECTFKSRLQKPVERLLLEFTFKQKPTVGETLVLYESETGEEWSQEYKQLTQNFYLNI